MYFQENFGTPLPPAPSKVPLPSSAPLATKKPHTVIAPCIITTKVEATCENHAMQLVANAFDPSKATIAGLDCDIEGICIECEHDAMVMPALIVARLPAGTAVPVHKTMELAKNILALMNEALSAQGITVNFLLPQAQVTTTQEEI